MSTSRSSLGSAALNGHLYALGVDAVDGKIYAVGGYDGLPIINPLMFIIPKKIYGENTSTRRTAASVRNAIRNSDNITAAPNRPQIKCVTLKNYQSLYFH
ncbi:kelch repeat protein [Cooperia oncophora]